MSWQLRAMVWGMRRLVRPHLARTTSPAQARRELSLAARCFRAPPHMLHLPRGGLHWISVGRCDPDRVILFLHGGAYLAGSPFTHAAMLGRLSKLTGLAVVAPDYRLAPEHPAPAAFEDAVAAHGALLAKGYAAEQIVLGGDSAGGGLALALLADLCARGLRPAGLFALSPWTDLALSGDSLRRNARADPLFPVTRMVEAAGYVLGGFPATDPRISPLYARFDAPPPVFLQVGTTEILLDDSRRMAERLRAAGGQVVLTEWPDAPHVWQLLDGYLPEARAALRAVAGFVRALTPLRPPRSGS